MENIPKIVNSNRKPITKRFFNGIIKKPISALNNDSRRLSISIATCRGLLSLFLTVQSSQRFWDNMSTITEDKIHTALIKLVDSVIVKSNG